MARQQALAFKIRVSFKGNVIDPLNIGVTRNAVIRTAEDAKNHCMAIIATDDEGQKITRIHHKDNETGEFYPAVGAEIVTPEAVPMDELPKIVSIQSGPPQPTK